MNSNMRPTAATNDLAPLLRSIGEEIRERNQRVAELEAHAARLAGDQGLAAEDLALVRSQLALHLRELRRAEKELEQLGWGIDPDHALRLVRRGPDGTAHTVSSLARTGFFQIPGFARKAK